MTTALILAALAVPACAGELDGPLAAEANASGVELEKTYNALRTHFGEREESLGRTRALARLERLVKAFKSFREERCGFAAQAAGDADDGGRRYLSCIIEQNSLLKQAFEAQLGER